MEKEDLKNLKVNDEIILKTFNNELLEGKVSKINGNEYIINLYDKNNTEFYLSKETPRYTLKKFAIVPNTLFYKLKDLKF